MLGIILTAASTFAETPTTDLFALSPEELFGATVTSVTRTSEKAWDVPAAITVLTQEDIARSGATSIPEVLRLVPGVDVARTSAGGWAVSIRGFNGELANKLLVLIDGREVYDPLFSGVFWDVQDVMMEDIDRIEVIRGPGASLWGANAVNGVINVVTKKASDTQGNLAAVTTGDLDRATFEERYGGRFGENGYYRVYGKYLDRENDSTPSGASAQDQQIADRGGFRADWKSPAGDDLTVQGDAYRNGDGDVRTISLFSPTYTPPFSETVDENVDSHGGNLLGRWGRTLNDGARMTVLGYADYAARDAFLGGSIHNAFDVDSQVELPQNGRHSIIYGASYRLTHEELTDSTPLLFYSDDTRNEQLFSAFVQDKITLDPKWFLTLGSKFEHNDYTGFEVEPTARLQFHPDDEQMIWAAVSRAVRTPSLLEDDVHAVQGVNGPISLDTLPNPDLDSEVVVAYELGYRRQLTPKASLDVATFYNDYSKLITYTFTGVSGSAVPVPHVIFDLVPLNNTPGESYGIETALDWRALPNLNLSGNYSLLKMVLHQPTVFNSPEALEGQSPQQQFGVRSQWDVSKAVSFDTMLYYVDSLPTYNLAYYWRLDTRLGWKIVSGLEFDLVGQNLLDNRHQEFFSPTDANAIEVERTFYGQFICRF